MGVFARADRIEALADASLVEGHLCAWAAEAGLAGSPWTRVFGRLKPLRSPWAVLAYEAEGGPTVRVLLHETDAGAPAGAVPAGPLGLIEISRCETDPGLPGLTAGTLGEPPLVPVHGAPHMHQWLVDGNGRLGLVDFDRYALGEPELDLATFLVELETESERTVPMAELEAAVVDGFRSAGGDLDDRRLALHTVHKRLAKVARTASALRPDAERRATGHLDRVEPALAALTPTPSPPAARRVPWLGGSAEAGVERSAGVGRNAAARTSRRGLIGRVLY